MRKIEIEMLDAIKNKKRYFKKANTFVDRVYGGNGYNDVFCYEVTLHGNDIAHIFFDEKNEGQRLLRFSLDNYGYKTNVTKSRLNAIGQIAGFKIYQSNFKWYITINGKTEIFDRFFQYNA